MNLTQDKSSLGLAQMSLAIARVSCQCQYLEYQQMDQNPLCTERSVSVVEMMALEKLWPDEKMSPAVSEEGKRG